MDVKNRTQHLTVRRLQKEFGAYGIEPPELVAQAIDHLDRIEATSPKVRNVDDVTAAYVAEDMTQVEAVTLEIVRLPVLQEAWAAARIKVASKALRAYEAHAVDLTKELAKIAAKHIKNLEKTPQIDGADIGGLLRDGRTEEAELLARLDYTAGELANLYSLRDRICRRADFGDGKNDCRYWKDPRKATQARVQRFGKKEPSRGELFVAGSKAGAGLWFPDPVQAEEQARSLARDAA